MRRDANSLLWFLMNLPWDPKTTHKLQNYHLHYSLSCVILQCESFGSLSEIVPNYDNVFIAISCLRQRTHDVYSISLQWCTSRNLTKCSMLPRCPWFYLRSQLTLLIPVNSLLFVPGPIEPISYSLDCLKSAQVAPSAAIMKRLRSLVRISLGATTWWTGSSPAPTPLGYQVLCKIPSFKNNDSHIVT